MRRLTVLLAAMLLAACAVPPAVPPAPLAGQMQAKPRLWYVGLGLYDETWSEGDVAATASTLARRAKGFRVTPTVLSYGSSEQYPAPDRRNVDAVMVDIARRAQPGDVVLIYLSTHGAPGLLAREADGHELETVGPEEVREWLAPLGDRDTVLVISACYSGSFIPSLRADHRIILAAARRDRTSFGCRAGSEHTVFGQALLDALAMPGTSLRSVVQQVRGEVAGKERALGVTLPSEPQVFVGPAVAALYAAPMF